MTERGEYREYTKREVIFFMELLKTKEAAMRLAVSETTVRRWVSLFPSSFPKDRFGHYLFDEAALEKLRQIKSELEGGTGLPDITLEETASVSPVAWPPSPALSRTASAYTAAAAEPETLLIRISQLEDALSHKADEVVSFQLLHHRQEMEEIRQTLAQLAASVEALYLPLRQTAAGATVTDKVKLAEVPASGRGSKKRRRFLFL
ncbi:MerR family transcriptional regulator [Paenibacillus sp. NPDC058071]|uniref:MerR family transcriptional regulator n=1 Tax=Paenibacillus sp. NPDC058071 TaxID=3346326 RepID=UPI0036DF74B0